MYAQFRRLLILTVFFRMAQVRNGQCRSWNEWRCPLDMQPPYHGHVGQSERAPPIHCPEKPRRDDGLKVQFGSGIPRAGTLYFTKHGIPISQKTNDNCTFHETTEGLIAIPVASEVSAYIPSSSELEAVTTANDTRRLHPPARYFR